MKNTVTWRTMINDWCDRLAYQERPQTTINLRRYQLLRFAEDHPRPELVTEEQIATWLVSHRWSKQTRRSYRSAIRRFYQWAVRTKRLQADPTADLDPVTADALIAKPAPEDIVDAAMVRADDRVQLMLLLASRQGMRRGEIARLHTDDLVRDLLGCSLIVHGKGGKDRQIPVNGEVLRRLRACPPGFVFPGQCDGHLSAPYVGKLMSRALEAGWTAHTLRHRFATRAYGQTRDLFAVQELLGHRRPETTRGYVRLPDDAMRIALEAAA